MYPQNDKEDYIENATNEMWLFANNMSKEDREDFFETMLNSAVGTILAVKGPLLSAAKIPYILYIKIVSKDRDSVDIEPPLH